MDLLDLMVKIGIDDQASAQIAGISKGITGALGTAAKVGAAAVGAVTVAAAGLTTGLVMGAASVAEYGDSIDKMSQKMGMSAEAYQEWDAVLQHSGTSMESARGAMRALSRAAESGSEAFEQLGLTQEQVASMSQEELFEATITGLQNVTDETERSRLASELLGRGAMELGALLNTSAEDTQAMRERVHELGGVMSDEAVKAAARFQDSLQDMQTAMSGLKRNMLAEFLPSFATVMDGLTEIFSGNSGGAELVSEGIDGIVATIEEAVPKMSEAVRSILPSLLKALAEIVDAVAMEIPALITSLLPTIIGMAPTVLDAAVQLFSNITKALAETGPELSTAMSSAVSSLIGVITESMPQMLDSAGELMLMIGEAIVDNLPEILDALIQLVTTLIQYVIDNGPQMLEAAGKLLLRIVEAISKALPTIIKSLASLLADMVKNVIEHGPEMLAGALRFLSNLTQGIRDSIGNVLTAMGEVVLGAINAVTGAIGDMLAAGRDFLNGMWDGVKEKAESVKTWFSNLPQNLLNALGNVSSILWDAGSSIISGLWDGLRSAWGGVTEWVGGLGSWIANHKGPLDYDRKLLVPAGNAIMYGFGESLEDSFDRNVAPFVESLADDLSGTVSLGVAENYNGLGASGAVVNNYYIDGNLVAADAVLSAALDTVAQRVSGRRRMGVAY